jgi:hypothetical protein
LRKKGEVVCLATFYETVESVRNSLAEEGYMSINVPKYERKVIDNCRFIRKIP